jgi:hypothetical protein
MAGGIASARIHLTMIDYFALALGHGLLAIALLRLVLREGLDSDPLIAALKDETSDNHKATSIAGRNASRRTRGGGDGSDSPPDA